MRRAEVKLIAGSIQVDRWTELDDGQLTSMFGCPSANVGTVLPLTSASAPNPKGQGNGGDGQGGRGRQGSGAMGAICGPAFTVSTNTQQLIQ
jgi:hypothetical protein